MSSYILDRALCYKTRVSKQGVAHRLWVRIEQLRVAKGLAQSALVAQSGISASTINRLKTSTRAPQPRIVYALADAVGLDRDEAVRLAGILPPNLDPDVSVRDAITRSTEYTQPQKDALLAVLDSYEATERQPGTGTNGRSVAS